MATFGYLAQTWTGTPAKAGTAQAKNRPVTLNASGKAERVNLTAEQYARGVELLIAGDYAALRTFLDGIETRKAQETGRVQLSPEGLASFRGLTERVAEARGVHPRRLAPEFLSFGIVLIDAEQADQTDAVLDSLFGAMPEDVPEPVADKPAK